MRTRLNGSSVQRWAEAVRRTVGSGMFSRDEELKSIREELKSIR
jgi:hypothetical protein